MNNPLSHLDEHGRPRMVDVGHKPPTHRTATATGFIHLQADTIRLIQDNHIKKGNVLLTAELAGVQAAKQTPNLIPLCHPLLLTQIDVQTILEEHGVRATAHVRCTGQTGVEMEALTSVTLALLTIYDMCKAVDKTMRITDITLLQKQKTAIIP